MYSLSNFYQSRAWELFLKQLKDEYKDDRDNVLSYIKSMLDIIESEVILQYVKICRKSWEAIQKR